jgi:hypothetical protein
MKTFATPGFQNRIQLHLCVGSSLHPPPWHTHHRQHPPHRTAREHNGCASRQPDSEVHVRVSAFTLHTQQLLAHAVTVRRTSEPGPCWHFSYINPTSDMLSLVCAVGSEGPALAQDDEAATIIQDAASDTATVLEDCDITARHTLSLLPSHTST